MQFVAKTAIKSFIVSSFIVSSFVVTGTAFAAPLTNYPSELVFLEHWNGLGDSGVNMVDYSLVVDANKKGVLTVQGFQVYQVMNVTLQDTASETSVIFNSFAEENMGINFVAGDKLFDINNDGQKLLTTWDKLQPSLDQNKNSGTYFEYE